MVGGIKMVQLFVNVDSEGNIIFHYSGENIIAMEPFDFFFLVEDAEIIDNLQNYKVIIEKFKPLLVKK